MLLHACLVCGAISPTRRCPQHGGTNQRPTPHQRGYGHTFRANRAKLLAQHPTCDEPGCTRPATHAHHDPPRRTLVARNATNPDGIEWLRPKCTSHHNRITAQGR